MTPAAFEQAVALKRAGVGGVPGVGGTGTSVAPRMGLNVNTTPAELGPLKPKQNAEGSSATSGTAPTAFANLDGLSAATGGVRAAGTIGGPRPPWLDVLYGGAPKTAADLAGPLAKPGDGTGPLATPDKKAPEKAPETPQPGTFSGGRLHNPYGSGYNPPAEEPAAPPAAGPAVPAAPSTPLSQAGKPVPGAPSTSPLMQPLPPPPGVLGGAAVTAERTTAQGFNLFPYSGLSEAEQQSATERLNKPPTSSWSQSYGSPSKPTTYTVPTEAAKGMSEESDYYTRADGTKVLRPQFSANRGNSLGLSGEAGAAASDVLSFGSNVLGHLATAPGQTPPAAGQGAKEYRDAVSKWEQERDSYYKSVGQPTAAEAVALRNSGAGVNRATGEVRNDTRNGLSMPADQGGQHFLDAAMMYGTAKIPGLGGPKPTGAAAKAVVPEAGAVARTVATDAAAAAKAAPKPAPVAAPKPPAPTSTPPLRTNQPITPEAYSQLSALAREEYDNAVRLGMKPPPAPAPAPRLYPETPTTLTPAGPQPQLAPLVPEGQAAWAAGGMKGPVPKPTPPGAGAPAPAPTPTPAPAGGITQDFLNYSRNPTGTTPAAASTAALPTAQKLPLLPTAQKLPLPSAVKPQPLPQAKPGPSTAAPTATGQRLSVDEVAKQLGAVDSAGNVTPESMARFRELTGGLPTGVSPSILPPKPVGPLDAARMFGRPKPTTPAVKPQPLPQASPGPAAPAPAAPKPSAGPSREQVVKNLREAPAKDREAAEAALSPDQRTRLLDAEAGRLRLPDDVPAPHPTSGVAAGQIDDAAAALKPPPGYRPPAPAAGTSANPLALPAQVGAKPVMSGWRSATGYAVDPFSWPGRITQGLSNIKGLPGWAQKGLDWTGRRIVDPAGTAAGTLTGTADLRQMFHATNPLTGRWSPAMAGGAGFRNTAIRGAVQTASGRPQDELVLNPALDMGLGRSKALTENFGGTPGADGKTVGGFGNFLGETVGKPLAEPLAPVDRTAARVMLSPDPIDAAYTGIGEEAFRTGTNVGNAAQRLGKQVETQAKDVNETGAEKPLGQYANEVKQNNPDLRKTQKGPPADMLVPSFAEVIANKWFGSPLPTREELIARHPDLAPADPKAKTLTAQPAATAEQDAQQFSRQFGAAVAAGDPAKVDAMVAEYQKKTPLERQAVAPITRLDARQFNMPEPELNKLVDGPEVQGSTPLSQRVAASKAEFQQLQSVPPEQQAPDHQTKVHAAQQRMADAERAYQGRLAQVYEQKILPGRIQQVDRNAPLLDAVRRKTEAGQPLTPEEQQQLPTLAAETRQAMGDVYKHALRRANLDFAVKGEPTAANPNMAVAGEVLKKIDEVKPVLGADGRPLTTVRVGPDGVPQTVPVTEPANPIGKEVHNRIVQDLTKAGVDDPQGKANDLFSQLEGLPKMLLLGGLGLGAVGLLASAFGIGGAAMPIMAALGGGAALLGLAGGNPSNLMSGDFWSGLPGMLGKIPGAIGQSLGLTSRPEPQPGQSGAEVNLQQVFSGPTGNTPFESLQRGLTPDVLQKMSPQQIAKITAAVRPDQRDQLKAHLTQTRSDLGLVVDQVNDYERQAKEMAAKPEGQRAPVPMQTGTLGESLKRFGVQTDASGMPNADQLQKLDEAKKTELIKSLTPSQRQEAIDKTLKYVDSQIPDNRRFLTGSVKSVQDLKRMGGLPMGREQKKQLAEAAALVERLQKGAELLYGGKADGKPNGLFPLKQLVKGRRHEREHTTNPAVSNEIAKDHLAEDPRYYTKLEQIEKGATLYPPKLAFAPHLTPDQMAAEGVYGRLTGSTGPRLAGKDTTFPDWYKQYHAGVRTPDDDLQMTRQRNFLSWHGPQFAKNPTPRRAFTLLNWGVDPNRLVAPEMKNDLRAQMLAYRKQHDSAWLAGRS